MDEHKPIASLSPTLLARKGGARPAMRQHKQQADQSHDDLGWNDHGHDADIIAIKPPLPSANAPLPDVLRQQQTIVERIVAAPRKSAAVSRRSALEDGRRAAFTLRLDAERHLKLRLACTMQGRSAQQLVIDALDQLIGTVPELDTLAAQVVRSR